MGAIWSYDDSNIIATKCIEKGIVPYGNAKARAVVWTFKDQIPLHREPLHSPRNDLVQKYPSFEDQKRFIVWIQNLFLCKRLRIIQKNSHST